MYCQTLFYGKIRKVPSTCHLLKQPRNICANSKIQQDKGKSACSNNLVKCNLLASI